MLLLVKIFIFELHKTQMIMKKIASISFFLMVNFLFSQTSDVKIEGDFNGDGKKEFAYATVSDCSDECEGNCITIIHFSDEKIKPITIKNAKNGDIYNLKDLNNDGADEIGFYPNWCTSCWHSFYVYTFKNNESKFLVKPIPTHCSQWEENKFPIEKDPLKKGFVRITSSVWKNDEIKVETKSVKLK